MTLATVILAAGRGSRLGRLAANRPKCLVAIAGRPLLSWQRDALRRAGAAPPILVRGWRCEALPPVDRETAIDVSDWQARGPMGSLRCVPPAWLRHGFLMSYGDVVHHPDTLAALRAHPGDLVIASDTAWRALWELRFDDPRRDAESFRSEQGRVSAIGERVANLDEIEGQFTGLLKASSAGAETLLAEARDDDDTTRLLARLVARGVRIDVLPIAGRWCEVDSATDLARYRRALQRTPRWSHDWRW